MLCQQCKAKQATVSMYANINGGGKQLSLCNDCANIVNQLVAVNIKSDSRNISSKSNIKCRCGATINELVNSGLCGCSECYRVFADDINMSTMRLQGGATHCGKTIYNISQPNIEQINEPQLSLQQQLELALQQERYLDAQRISDMIKELSDE